MERIQSFEFGSDAFGYVKLQALTPTRDLVNKDVLHRLTPILIWPWTPELRLIRWIDGLVARR